MIFGQAARCSLRGTWPSVVVRRTCFSTSARRYEIRMLDELPHCTPAAYQETKNNDLLCLQWPSPPRNVLLTKKRDSPVITKSLIEYAKHIQTSYEGISLILEEAVADAIHEQLPAPVYTWPAEEDGAHLGLHDKVDLVSTLGGDGTILHASSLFASAARVPPILSFSMGTLGFLGEWKFKEYKRAFREAYMSGATMNTGYSPALVDEAQKSEAVPPTLEASSSPTATAQDGSPHQVKGMPTGWSSIRGKSLGKNRGARVLLRNRLQIGVFDADGNRVSTALGEEDVYAMNEVIIYRGSTPHLTVLEVYIGGRFLTEAVADGMIVSTPTGSTAYSLSSGGSIVHPLVSSLLLTPVCPRSLSFRPLVLPANTPITLRLSEKNRAQEVDVSIDGIKNPKGLRKGMEVRVWGESIRNASGEWSGGVPSIVRGALGSEGNGEDHWVGGLNGLLKFNHPFGEQTE